MAEPLTLDFENQKRFAPFSQPWYKLSASVIIKEAINFYSESLALVLSMAANVFIFFINIAYIGSLGDELLLASFGLGVSYIFFMFLSLNLSCFEVQGIFSAKNFGARNFAKCSDNLYQGLLYTSCFMLFYVIVFIFCEDILLLMEVAPENAKLTGYMMIGALPGCLIQAVNDQFKA